MATAIESMTGVMISSAYFPKNTKLVLFPMHKEPQKINRVAMLYGKNGSGKSTIAQGFREYKFSDIPCTVSLEPICSSSDMMTSSKVNTNKLFVFDEDYVSSRVKIKGSGLDAIVLFGNQVDIEDQIETILCQIKDKQMDITLLKAEHEAYEDCSDVNSPLYWFAQIRTKLHESHGWADVGAKIKGQKQNLSVNESEIARIGGICPDESLDDLQSERKLLYAQYISVNSASTLLTMPIETVSAVKEISDNVQIHLTKIVEKPQLTDRETLLLELFGINCVNAAKTFLLKTSNHICDKCFQPIEDDYRATVLSEIGAILNRDVEDFKGELEILLIPEIPAETYQVFRDLPSYRDLSVNLQEYNNAIVSHNLLICTKMNNPFTELEYDSSIDVVTACHNLNQVLMKLEDERISLNHVISDRNDVKTELLRINDAIAHYCIASMYENLHSQKILKDKNNENLTKAEDRLKDLDSQKMQLDSQRKNYNIAAEEINNSLEYIFFHQGRLSLELGFDQVYHLKVNGNQVKPNKVSCGERNALALCYFFTEIAKEMDAKSIYTEEVLLVIDDPLSSFDLENRIGIFSFLRWKLEQILVNCPTSKILIMTHDIGVMFDMKKALSEITKHCEKLAVSAENCLFQLNDKKLSAFKYAEHNEYTQLLQMVYEYAINDNATYDIDLLIGNAMRRVLEAFAYFSYKKDIYEVSLDQRVLDQLPDDRLKKYYRNLMYRLVLNNESHFKEHIQGAPEISFFSHLSSNDKQRTARDVLCFMYHLNPTHILSHLPYAESYFTKWCKS